MGSGHRPARGRVLYLDRRGAGLFSEHPTAATGRPVELPEDGALWPTVDVFIPRYNESLSVVKPTVLAALGLDWPASKLNVYVLDDGKHPEFREFAAKCGAQYIIRPNNAHAKAGNLNHALGITKGEFVAIFDCDHIPVRTFLTSTMGWFARDPKCSHGANSASLLLARSVRRRNLGTFQGQVPNEGNLFYGLIQDGNDLWNAAFFCGSCAVLRRAPLEQIGGIAVETVTEDAHTALKLHRNGYTTAYLRRVLAGGLATESLASHIEQRIRWARGMAQIFRLDNPPTGAGLSFFQRLCYSNAMLHFFSRVSRDWCSSPLPLHHSVFFNFTSSTPPPLRSPCMRYRIYYCRISRTRICKGGSAIRSGMKLMRLCCRGISALPTTLALINPRLGKFNVTTKGGLVEHDFFDWRISAPYLVLVLLNVVGVLLAIPRLLFWNSFEADNTVIMKFALDPIQSRAAGCGAGCRRGDPPAADRAARHQEHACYLVSDRRHADRLRERGFLDAGSGFADRRATACATRRPIAGGTVGGQPGMEFPGRGGRGARESHWTATARTVD